MKKQNVYIIIGILLLAAAVVIAWLLVNGLQERRQAEAQKESPRSRPVKVVQAEEPPEYEVHQLPCVVIPATETRLAFRVAGPVIQLDVELGKRLLEGDLIARVDPRDYETQASALEKKLDSAILQHSAAAAQARNAEMQFARVEALFEQKATTKKVYDEVEAARDAAMANTEALAAVVKEVEEALQNARDQMADTYLLAPFEGYVNTKFVERGAVVAAGLPVVGFMRESAPEVQINLPGDLVNRIQEAREFQAFFDMYPNRSFPARFKEISRKPAISRQTYPMTLVLDEVSGISLNPGMAGIINFRLPTERLEGVVVPLESVFSDESGRILVWVFDEESGRVSIREVELQEVLDDGRALITGNVRPGEWVAAAGVHTLTPEMPVRRIDNSSDSNPGRIR
jgi:RND family efflux transporter MFP subunit